MNFDNSSNKHFVGNATKARISKRVLREKKKSTSNFPENEQGQKMFVYRKIWYALFSCNTRFETCLFAFRTLLVYFHQPLHATGIFLYSLKTTKPGFSDLFIVYRKRPVAQNVLNQFHLPVINIY